MSASSRSDTLGNRQSLLNVLADAGGADIWFVMSASSPRRVGFFPVREPTVSPHGGLSLATRCKTKSVTAQAVTSSRSSIPSVTLSVSGRNPVVQSRTTREFRDAFASLPDDVRRHAQRAYRLFCTDPRPPSLRFKKVDEESNIYSVRSGLGYRALGVMEGVRCGRFYPPHSGNFSIRISLRRAAQRLHLAM